MIHAEDQECMNLVRWTSLASGKYPELRLLFHIPLGGKRGKREAVRFKAMGVQAGIPDYFLPVAKGSHHGLWIEMKRPARGKSRRGTVTKAQQEWIDRLTDQGYLCVVCWGWESARDALEGYLDST